MLIFIKNFDTRIKVNFIFNRKKNFQIKVFKKMFN